MKQTKTRLMSLGSQHMYLYTLHALQWLCKIGEFINEGQELSEERKEPEKESGQLQILEFDDNLFVQFNTQNSTSEFFGSVYTKRKGTLGKKKKELQRQLEELKGELESKTQSIPKLEEMEREIAGCQKQITQLEEAVWKLDQDIQVVTQQKQATQQQ